MVLALVGSALLLTSLNFSMMFVAFGDISESFDASEATVSWALTGFTIMMASMIIPAGWLADRYGRKRILLTGLTIFGLGAAIIGWSPTVVVLIIGRLVQAAGLGMQSSAALAIVLDAFGSQRRSSAVGAIGALGGVSAALGPVIGGALLDVLGWRQTFGLNTPAAILVAVLLWWQLADDRAGRPVATDRPPPDMLGVVGLMVSISSLALAIVQLDEWGWSDPRIVGAAAVGLAALALLITRSLSHPDPVLHLPLYRVPNFALGSSLNLIVAGSFGGMYLAFVGLLIDGWELSLGRAGLALSIIPVIGGPLSFVSGAIADRYGHRSVILPGTLLMAGAGLFFFYATSEEPSVASVWIPGSIAYGVGVGLAHTACHASALREVPDARIGVGGAMSRIGLDVGSTISVAVVVVLVASAGNPVDGVRRAALLLTITSIVGAVMSTRLAPKPAEPATPTTAGG